MGYFDEFNQWFDQNPYDGIGAFMLLHFVWVPMALPSCLLNMLGGFVFSLKYGPVLGFFFAAVVVWICEPLAALLTFFIGRFVF